MSLSGGLQTPNPPSWGSNTGLRGSGPAPTYLTTVGVLHDKTQAVMGLEGVLQGLRGTQSWDCGPPDGQGCNTAPQDGPSPSGVGSGASMGVCERIEVASTMNSEALKLLTRVQDVLQAQLLGHLPTGGLALKGQAGA